MFEKIQVNYALITNILLSFVAITLVFPEHYNSKSIIILSLWSIFLYVKKEHSFSLLKPNNFLLRGIIYSYIVFLTFNIFSLFYTSNLAEGLKVLILRIPLFLLPIVLITCLKHINFKQLGIVFILSTVLYCIYLDINVVITIMERSEPISFIFSKYLGRPYIQIVERSIHAPYLALFILGSLVFSQKFIINKSLKIIASIFLMISIYLVSSKMSFVILCILIIIYFLFYLRKKVSKHSFIKFVIVFLLISSLFVVKSRSIVTSVVQKYEINNPNNLIFRIYWLLQNKDRDREENWQSSVQTIRLNWLYGVGIGDVIDELQKNRPKESWAYKYEANAHNQYFEEFVRLGVIGGLSFTFTIIGMLLYALYHQNKLLFAFSLIIFLSLISESMLARNKGLVFIIFFSSILILNSLKLNKKY